jgi:predicted HTH domain antitoxin
MKILEIPYADSLPDAVRMSVSEFERELKLALAAKLFELGRLSSGQAAELAGVGRVEFLKNLSRYNVKALDWDIEQFSQEINNA